MATASSYSSAMGSGDFDPDVVTEAAKTQPVIVPYEEDQVNKTEEEFTSIFSSTASLQVVKNN
jgi:hypothetical protein